MSDLKIREEFEAACREHAESAGFEESGPTLVRSTEDSGCYQESHTQAAWWAWQEALSNAKEVLASKLISQLSLNSGKPVEWCDAVIITAIVTGMTEKEKARLLAMDMSLKG